MKIAIQNPTFIFGSPETNFNGYNVAFLRAHADFIYLTRPWEYVRYRRRLRQLNMPDIPCLFRMRALNHNVDVLLHFGGEPYLPMHRPPSRFSGMKIWHVLDY